MYVFCICHIIDYFGHNNAKILINFIPTILNGVISTMSFLLIEQILQSYAIFTPGTYSISFILSS